MPSNDSTQPKIVKQRHLSQSCEIELCKIQTTDNIVSTAVKALPRRRGTGATGELMQKYDLNDMVEADNVEIIEELEDALGF